MALSIIPNRIDQPNVFLVPLPGRSREQVRTTNHNANVARAAAAPYSLLANRGSSLLHFGDGRTDSSVAMKGRSPFETHLQESIGC